MTTETSMTEWYQYDGINDSTKHYAIQECGENPSTINDQVECFRRRVVSMPHLQCPKDAKFLLRFLRVSNFDMEKAQKRLDNFCTVRSSSRGSPEFFQFYKHDDSMIETFLNLKFQIPLGRCDSGEFVFLYRFKLWDPKRFPLDIMSKLIYMGIDALISQEEYQIFGTVWFMDLEDISLSLIQELANPAFVKKCYRIVQDSYPIKMSGQVLFSDSSAFDVVFHLMCLFMKSELKRRTFRMTRDMERAIQIFPGIDKVLPKEYNGKAGTLDEIAKKWSKTFRDYFKDGDPLSSIHVNEDKRPVETLIYLSEHENGKA